MNDFLRNAAVIPSHWSADDAVLVTSFLQEIIDAIWLVHGEGMSLVHKKQELRQYVLELAKADELNPA